MEKISTHILESIHWNTLSKCHFWQYNHFKKFTQQFYFQEYMQKIIRAVYKVVHMKTFTVALSIMLKSQNQSKLSTTGH